MGELGSELRAGVPPLSKLAWPPLGIGGNGEMAGWGAMGRKLHKDCLDV